MPQSQTHGKGTRRAIGCVSILAALFVSGAIAFFVSDAPRPRGEQGAAAEALADRIEQAVGADAWERTGAIGFTFARTGNRHLWDRRRHFARTRWGDLEAQVALDDPLRGVAFRGSTRLRGEEARETIRRGWELFINDSFWLAAPFKVRDPGTSRAIVGEDLLVSYASGGVTPGDAYLWSLAEDGTPRAWRMWVSVLPIGGLEVRWEEWIALPTGARIARRRVIGPVTLEMSDLVAGATLEQIEPGPDPFAPLAAE